MRARPRNNSKARRTGRSLGLRPGKVFRHGDPAQFAPDEPPPKIALAMTRRQRCAFENPVYPEDGEMRYAGWALDHSPDPRFRTVEMHVEPHKTESITYGGEDSLKRTIRKRYQLVSILTIEMESRPVWHASIAIVVNRDVNSEVWAFHSWRGWMRDLARKKFAEMIPDMLTRPVHEELGHGKQSLHYRAPLTPEELGVLRAIMKPRIVSAPAGVIARLQAERGELAVPGGWLN
jgi:hypothetical protein